MGVFTNVSALFRARLHIGYVAFPYAVLGFVLHWALFSFDLGLFIRDEGSFFRLLISILIAFIYMPYLFVINDFFDAEYDKFDEKKRKRNPFCKEEFRSNKFVQVLIFIPGLVTLILGFLISYEAGLITILVLFLGTFYSAPPLRFKEWKLADFTVHGICLGFYFFLLGFYSIYLTPNPYILPVFWLILYLSFIDASWIHLDSAIVDYYTDKLTETKTTVVSIGPEKSVLILILMLFSVLIIPSLFLVTNSNLLNNFSAVSRYLAIIFLLLPFSYLILVYFNRDHFEKIRAISSRYRVYVVYSLTIFILFMSNASIYI
jgi:4-hydroxybenzoate polyprenyltransferase